MMVKKRIAVRRVQAAETAGLAHNSTVFTPDFCAGDRLPFAPALAARGPYAVGTRLLAAEGWPVGFELWYPAELRAGMEARTRYTSDFAYSSAGEQGSLIFPGGAERGAPVRREGMPQAGWPLILFVQEACGTSAWSHAAEHLASYGFVIASVRPAQGIDAAAAARLCYKRVTTMANEEKCFLYAAVDGPNLGILAHENACGEAVRALGGSARALAFSSPVALDRMTDGGTPLFVLLGDAQPGAQEQRAQFEALCSERWLLVIENAGANALQNPPCAQLAAADMADAYHSRVEYAWDAARLNAMTDHFLTAFFRRFLADDTAMERYLIGLKERPDGMRDADGNAWEGFTAENRAVVRGEECVCCENITMGLQLYHRGGR